MLSPHPRTRSLLFLTGLFTAAAGAARAQTTDAERKAAAAILKQTADAARVRALVRP